MNTAELRELVQAGEGGLLAVERLPVRGSRKDELDQRRVEEYFRRIFGAEEVDDWTQTLLHRELLVETDVDAALCCSYAGYALFALEPRRRLPQAGMRLLVFPGTDMDYDANRVPPGRWRGWRSIIVAPASRASRRPTERSIPRNLSHIQDRRQRPRTHRGG